MDIDASLLKSLRLIATPEPRRSLIYMVGTLQNDFHRVASIHYLPEQEGTILRLLVWTASSFVEGTISAFSQILINDTKIVRSFTQQQRLILKDQRIVGGKVRPFFRPVEQKLEAVVAMFAIAYRPNWTMEVSEDKSHFSDFIKLRDRMTHPTSGGDLWCEDEDKVSLREGMAWFDRQITSLTSLN